MATLNNRSVWQEKAGVTGVIRESAVIDKLRDGEILVKAHAWGLNPADHMIQDVPLPFITYPLILGEDVAGTVERVSPAASHKFKQGDRVAAVALGAVTMRSEEGCFQDYVVNDHTVAFKIPDSMSFVDAAVLPLSIATAGQGLFSKDYLNLPYPKLSPTSSGKSIFIWGGSSSVGSSAIQLCRFAGFDVITTCSTRNFDYVRGLGASKAFDYTSPTVVDDVAVELDKTTCVGIYHAAGPVKPSCLISEKSKQKLFVASTTPVMPEDALEGVEAKMIYAEGGGNIYAAICSGTFGSFIPEALAKGVFKVAPSAEVVKTKGVQGIQEGLDILKKGVSAKKIVVKNE